MVECVVTVGCGDSLVGRVWASGVSVDVIVIMSYCSSGVCGVSGGPIYGLGDLPLVDAAAADEVLTADSVSTCVSSDVSVLEVMSASAGDVD